LGRHLSMDALIRSIYLTTRQIIIQNDSVLNEFALEQTRVHADA
jgi:hypothetical protein